MASTVDSSSLTIRISEEVELNGKKSGNSNIRVIKGINEVSERIITALTTGTDLLKLDTVAGAGTFIRDNVKHIRITNLDNENFVRLSLITDADPAIDIHVKVPALDSFILSNGLTKAVVDAGNITFNNITSIKAYANAASVDLEVFIAST